MCASPAFCAAPLPPRVSTPQRARRLCARRATKHARPRAPVALYRSPRPPGPPSTPQRCPEYYANVGCVIDTLRADYPHLLSSAPDFSIYTEGVSFADASGNRIFGKRAYANILWLLRTQAALFLCGHCVYIQSLYHDDSAGTVHIRWRAHLSPRSWILLSGQRAIVLDGMSVYRLNTEGWVYEHSLENSVRRKGPVHALESVWALGNISDGKAVGAGAGAGNGSGPIPGWYRSQCNKDDDDDAPAGEHSQLRDEDCLRLVS